MDLWWDIKFLLFCCAYFLRMMSQQWYQSHLYNPETDLGRASCRVIGLCLSPNNYSACLYTVPSTVELLPHAIRCRKVPFLTSRNSIASS
ncbi:hypothetical protein GQ457_07G005630 [Hibiscus cannabinus]